MALGIDGSKVRGFETWLECHAHGHTQDIDRDGPSAAAHQAQEAVRRDWALGGYQISRQYVRMEPEGHDCTLHGPRHLGLACGAGLSDSPMTESFKGCWKT